MRFGVESFVNSPLEVEHTLLPTISMNSGNVVGPPSTDLHREACNEGVALGKCVAFLGDDIDSA